MVLESLFPVRKVIKKPIDMFLFSMVISFASIFLAHLIFPGISVGKIMTLFITVAMTPMIYGIFRAEEEVERKQAEHKIHKTFLDRHDEAIRLFTLFFLGVFVAVFFLSLILPTEYVVSTFEDQLLEIGRIRGATGYVTLPTILNIIIMNNLRVMGLSFLLSFLIGSGAIVILSWNASILALYLASFVRRGLIAEFLIRTVSIIPHAPIEILAYFLAGIAGGVLSVGMIRERIRSKEFFLVFRDSLILLGLAVLAVLVGGFIEVFL